MTDDDLTAEERKILDAYRMMREHDPILADTLMLLTEQSARVNQLENLLRQHQIEVPE